MAEFRRSRVSHRPGADQRETLFLVQDASPVEVQFATFDRSASAKLLPGPAWVEQDGRRVRISVLQPGASKGGQESDSDSLAANESCLPPNYSNDDGLSPSQFRRVLSVISERLSSNLSLSELAREAGLSAAYFSQRFKLSTGTSPHQYLLRLRICKAKTLLEESEAPVIDIAAECGFQTQQHFARIFRRLTGKTPTEYRRERQRTALVSTYAALTAHREVLL
jgi:AraC family transcriptional regulator